MSKKSEYQRGIRLNKPGDVRRLISRIINELREDTITENKARAMGYLCNCLLKAMETTELAERLEKLEAAMKDNE